MEAGAKRIDFRVKTTLASIDEAFLSLLKERPLGKITIKEICDRATINRATFYRHYGGVDDLMQRTEIELLTQLEVRIAGQQMDVEEILVNVLEAIKCDSDRYTVLFSENGDASFSVRVLSVAYSHTSESLETIYPDLTVSERRWLFDYVAYGLSAIWRDWIEDGMKESPKDVARFAASLVSVLKYPYFKCN